MGADWSAPCHDSDSQLLLSCRCTCAKLHDFTSLISLPTYALLLIGNVAYVQCVALGSNAAVAAYLFACCIMACQLASHVIVQL